MGLQRPGAEVKSHDPFEEEDWRTTKWIKIVGCSIVNHFLWDIPFLDTPKCTWNVDN